jgi:hypothetical protein
MNQSPKPFQLGITILIIFVAGAVGGGFLGARLEHDRLQGQAEIQNLPENVMTLLTRRLSLTDSQNAAIAPFVDQACGELHVVYQTTSDQITQILAKYYEILSKELSEDQAKILGGMEEELRAKADNQGE